MDRDTAVLPPDPPSGSRSGSRSVSPAGPGPARRGRPPGRRAPAWVKWVLLALVAVLAVVAVTALAGYRYTDKLLTKGQRAVPNLVKPVNDSPQNILLVGSDSREGLSKADLQRIGTDAVEGQRTDTIIVVHIDPRMKKVALLSIPRDLKVKINGSSQKINAAYAGGPGVMVKTVEQATGLQINHYVELDFAGFLGVVDKLGGVKLCNTTGHRLDDAFANLHMAPGCHVMNGTQALAFVRARHIDSDFGRIGRQQEFIRAVMGQIASKGNVINLPKLISIANTVSDHVHTDNTLRTGEALALARRIGKLDPKAVDMRLLPSYDPGAACNTCPDYVLASPEARILLKALKDNATTLPALGLPGDPNGSASLRSTVVDVLNGSGAPGAAGRAAQALQGLGLVIGRIGNAPAQTGALTTLAYPNTPKGAGQAKLLGSLLGPDVKLVPSTTGGSHMVLTVGSSFDAAVLNPTTS